MLLNHKSFHIASSLSTLRIQPYYILFLKCFFLCTLVIVHFFRFLSIVLITSVFFGSVLFAPWLFPDSHTRLSFLCVFYLNGAFYSVTFSSIYVFSSLQFSSVAQSCPTLCDPMNRSKPGLPVHHQLPEFIHTHVHRVSDAIQPSHPLLSPSPPSLNPSHHQSLSQWVNSSHEVAKVLEFQL